MLGSNPEHTATAHSRQAHKKYVPVFLQFMSTRKTFHDFASGLGYRYQWQCIFLDKKLKGKKIIYSKGKHYLIGFIVNNQTKKTIFKD